AGPPPMITTRFTEPSHHPERVSARHRSGPTRSAVFSLTPGADYRPRRASLRRVRLKPRPWAAAGLRSAFAHTGYRLAGRPPADYVKQLRDRPTRNSALG